MPITSIEKQKRSKKRWNIYVDGEFFCGLYADTILKYGLHVNNEYNETKLHEIKDYDEFIYGKEIALSYLSYRIRTVSELKKKLKEKKVSAKSANKVLKYLEDSGLTNDEEFAKALIEEKIKRKPVGIRILKQKLFEKGVPKEVGEKVLENVFTNIDEKQLALQNFKKLYPKIKNKDKAEQRKKTYEYLTRKGFGYSIINEIVYEEIK
ncbi:MAG TPA: RecX family transcriptional regulator [Ignavibacteria bacterium]|jgi:regulatory protein